jgi:Fur family transcriptional regulator, stress-responsive regulator
MTPSAAPGDIVRAGGDGTAAPRDRLRVAGLRITMPRLAVLRWLWSHPHSKADEVASAVREQLGSVSTQAIYDVLNACTIAGLLRRIEPAGHPARFEARVSDNHHHLVCRVCGRTEDVDCVHGRRTVPDPLVHRCLRGGRSRDRVLGCLPVLPVRGPSHHHEEGRL